jgi:hypothetical protein
VLQVVTIEYLTTFYPSCERAVPGVDGILNSLYKSLSTAIGMKQSMEDHRHGNLDNILTLADGGVSHADVNREGYSWTQRLRRAMLPKWWQSDGDVVTTQNIKL